MISNYSFGDYVFKIESTYPFFCDFAKDYLSSRKEDYQITSSDEDIEKWKNAHHEEGALDYIETLYILSKVCDYLANHNVYLMHGSSAYLFNKDNGYLFLGPSGIGKSTHVAKLKNKYRDKMAIINDDKPFVSLTGDKFYIYGSPWNGKAHLSNNAKSELKGIFFLHQSLINSIKKLEAKDAIECLFKQTHIPNSKNAREKGLDFLVKLASSINVYSLSLNLDDDSTIYSSRIMEGESLE